MYVPPICLTGVHVINLEHHSRVYRPVARGGVVGVPTPRSGINDIDNFNYLIQERPFDCF